MVPGFTIDHSIDQVDLLKFFLQSFPFSNKTSQELQKLPNTSWLESQVQMLYLSVLSVLFVLAVLSVLMTMMTMTSMTTMIIITMTTMTNNFALSLSGNKELYNK